MTYLVEYEGIE